ncbi:MAG: Aspartate aminotransferase, partial [Streblomastix strix]
TANRVLGFVNAPSMMQFAVEKAITCNIDKSVEWYKERRDLLYKGIIEAGLECNLPEGAFYLFPKVPQGCTDFRFSAILKEKLVLAVPGSAFGDSRCVRFAYCCDIDTIERAIPRIAEAVKIANEEKEKSQ